MTFRAPSPLLARRAIRLRRAGEFSAFALLALAAFAAPRSALAAPGEPTYAAPQIRVQAAASETAPADVAELRLLVRVVKPSAAEATRELDLKAKALVDKLAALGVPAENLRNAGADFAPAGSGGVSSVIGRGGDQIEARRWLVARLARAQDVARVVPGLLADQAEALQGVVFSLSDEERRLDRLREKAAAEARRLAESSARAAGGALGELLYLAPRETSAGGEALSDEDGPRGKYASKAGKSGSLWPTEPIAVTLEARASAVWALAKPAP
jgi:uncharacterized protein YggE